MVNTVMEFMKCDARVKDSSKNPFCWGFDWSASGRQIPNKKIEANSLTRKNMRLEAECFEGNAQKMLVNVSPNNS